MLGLILAVIIIGFVTGVFARAVLPGNDSMSLGATTLLGIVGSFIGGFLGYVLFDKDTQSGMFQPAGIIGSVVGAIIVLALMRRSHARTI